VRCRGGAVKQIATGSGSRRWLHDSRVIGCDGL
jgi:hypothetical protein